MVNKTDQDQDLPSGLYIIATPIGNMGDMTSRAVELLRKVDIIACEDTRETGRLTSYHGIDTKKLPYHEHNSEEMRPKILDMLSQGMRVGLVSDAGMPLVSDPGYKLVQACIAAGHTVTCAPGASASLTALVLSGLPSDRFLFAGFLPAKATARRAALSDLRQIPVTTIFYETAPRLAESLTDMQDILGDRPAAVARELTKKFEEVRRGLLSELAAFYKQDGDPRGEIVVVVAPPLADAQESWTEARIDALLAEAMDVQNLSVRDASALVAARTGRKKSDIYQRALLRKNAST